jgi:hypothetical protein
MAEKNHKMRFLGKIGLRTVQRSTGTAAGCPETVQSRSYNKSA